MLKRRFPFLNARGGTAPAGPQIDVNQIDKQEPKSLVVAPDRAGGATPGAAAVGGDGIVPPPPLLAAEEALERVADAVRAPA